MIAQRKTDSNDWLLTSVDYILRNIKHANIKIGGTNAKPIMSGDDGIRDHQITSFILKAGEKGVVINSLTLRLTEV